MLIVPFTGHVVQPTGKCFDNKYCTCAFLLNEMALTCALQFITGVIKP